MTTVADVDLTTWNRYATSPRLRGSDPFGANLNAIATVTDVLYGVTATLDATTSTDASGTITGWLWEQVGGVSVGTITNATTATATFTAPNRSNTCTFRLTITSSTSATNTVDIVVQSKELSTYEKILSFPTKDLGQTEQTTITTVGDLSKLNNATYRIFWVAAGVYNTTTRYALTLDGSKGLERWILLDRTDDAHPATLAEASRAKLALDIQADWWIIDRMSFYNSSTTFNPVLFNVGSNNIINRWASHDVGNGIAVWDGSNSNTIQNSRFERDDISIFHDRAQVGVSAGVSYATWDGAGRLPVVVSDTVIVNNEFYNAVDAFQTVRQTSGTADAIEDLDFKGTIFDNNVCYIDGTIYTDGSGNHDAAGTTAFAENAIDLKCGSKDPANRMKITNNRMWGYRLSDTSLSSGLNDPGSAFTIHFGVNYCDVTGNVMADSRSLLDIAAPWWTTYAMENSTISDNILHGSISRGMVVYDTQNLTFDGNVFSDYDTNIGGDTNIWMYLGWVDNMTFTNNIMSSLDARTVSQSNSSQVEVDTCTWTSNTLWDATKSSYLPALGFTTAGSDPLALYTDLSWDVDRFTTTPWIKTLTKVVAP